jgi:AcrR family transcriptional regulator
MKKKFYIIDAATRLFASQGFDATTTIQISEEASVTEPLLYYHFKGKDELYTSILNSVFNEYFVRLESLKVETQTWFDKIANIIALHYQLIEEKPYEFYLTITPYPTRLKDPEDVYNKNMKRQADWFKTYFSNCLRKGMKSGEFVKVPVPDTINLLVLLVKDILRQQGVSSKANKKARNAMIDFCRRSLVAK